MSTQPTPTPSRFLDPAALLGLRNLGLAARLVVEGLYSGQHRSPHRGYSIEFAEHRQYTPGVDPRHLDWKILGKRDKLYVKQYEEQTNLRCHLILDVSASMGYRHGGAMTKLEYACYLAASLSYLMQTQHDAFGLMICGPSVQQSIPPRQGKAHLRVVLETLDALKPQGTTDLERALHQLAQTARRRALVVVISDLFSSGTTRELLEALGHLRHRKHEVVVMQTLDPSELTFPFTNAGQIRDVETQHVVAADARAMRRHYLQQIENFISDMRVGCLSREIGFALAQTDQPFELFLGQYLTRRQQGLL